MDASHPARSVPVLLLARTFPPEDIGGVASYCRAVALALAEDGIEVHVLTPRKTPGIEKRQGNLLIHPVLGTGGRAVRFFRYLAAFLRLRKQYPGAVVLVGYWIPTAIAVWLVSFLSPVCYGVLLYGADVWGYPSRVEQWLLRAVCRRAKRLLTITRYTEREIHQAIPAAPPIALVPCTIDPKEMEAYRVPQGQDPKAEFGLAGKRVILTASCLGFRKGHLPVLEAIAELVREYPDLVYVYTGRGPARAAIEDKVKELGLAEHVRAMGFVDYPTLMRLYQAADVFAMVSYNPDNPADFEGFGIVYLEAGYWGVPSVAARYGGPVEVVQDGVTGILTEPLSQEELTGALRALLGNPEKRRRMGAAAHERTLRLFSRPAMAKAIRSALGL
jgi:phosphatidylinositol alpha-1,6-mannosyltransferase